MNKELTTEEARQLVINLTVKLDELENTQRNLEALRREVINKYNLNKE